MKQRVLTAALLIPPVLLAVFLSSPLPLFGLAFISQVIGSLEIGRIARKADNLFPAVGLICLVTAAYGLATNGIFPHGWREHTWWGLLYGERDALVAALAASVIGTVGCVSVARGARGFVFAEISSLWLAGGLTALVVLHGWYGHNDFSLRWSSPLLLALIPLWIGDSAAIFAGKAFGKHLLAPKISPKKTMEGGIANLLGCVLGAVGVAALIGQPMLVGVLAGIATGTLGQAGDLLESAMKRSADLKDSGNLLPGHGGLLDRIDSILLSAPAVAVIVLTAGVMPAS